MFYEWDVENRLLAVDLDGDGTADEGYAYDADGLHVGKTDSTGETRFLLDTNRQYAEVLEEYTPSGLILASYVHGRDLISQNINGEKSFLHADGIGSTRLVTNTVGDAMARFAYDAFGRMIDSSGMVSTPFLYTGEYRDEASGLYYLRSHFLDPQSGRFLGRDAFPGILMLPISQHPYLYAHADAVNRNDPGGQFSLAEIGVALSIQNILQAGELTLKTCGYVAMTKGTILFVGMVAGTAYLVGQTIAALAGTFSPPGQSGAVAAGMAIAEWKPPSGKPVKKAEVRLFNKGQVGDTLGTYRFVHRLRSIQRTRPVRSHRQGRFFIRLF